MSWLNRLRNPPQVNYNEESEEEDLETGLNFASPLTSPGRPHQSPSVSPLALLQPEPVVDEVLKKVNDELSLEEVNNKLSDLNTDDSPEETVAGSSEETVTGQVKGGPSSTEVDA